MLPGPVSGDHRLLPARPAVLPPGAYAVDLDPVAAVTGWAGATPARATRAIAR